MKKKTSVLFKVFKFFVKVFSPKMQLKGIENLPKDEPTIIVGNHCQMYGPIACEVYLPDNAYIWCAGQMMRLKDVPQYAFEDFWSQKPKWTHPFYKILAYVIAPMSVCVFNNARTIAVYRDARIMSTFRETLDYLNKGISIVIFPEHDVKHNNIVYDFQKNFIDIAKLYYGKTKKAITFTPMYIAPNLKEVHFGKPIIYNPDNHKEEKDRICQELMEDITSIAKELPMHTVVPYRNIPKKLYPKNRGE